MIGSKFNIWTSNWLPGHSSFKPCTRNSSGHYPQSVAELIIKNGNFLSWDIGKRNEYFLPVYLDRITSLPLANINTPDFLTWLSHCDGLYSFKRGYYFAKYLQSLAHAQP